MKRLLRIILAIAPALPLCGDVANSENYRITNAEFPGGGGRSAAGPYESEISISPIAGRGVAAVAYRYTSGYLSALNNPPVAADDLRSYPLNTAIDLLEGTLLVNDTDPENDLLEISAVPATSAAGGVLSLTTDAVHYVPPTGYSAVDSFPYEILDSEGDSASATVLLYFAPPVGDQPINSFRYFPQSDGTVLLRFRGQSGSSEFQIEHTADLNQNFQFQQAFQPGPDGVVEFLIDPADARQAYYRALAF